MSYELTTYRITGIIQLYVGEDQRWLERPIRTTVRAESPAAALDTVIACYDVTEQVDARWHSPHCVRVEVVHDRN